MKIELTVSAFRTAYSGASLFLVGEDVLPALQDMLGNDIRFLLLGADGCIYSAGEERGGLDTRRAPVGMAIGVRGMLVGKATHAAAKAWDEHARRQQMFTPAPIRLLTGMKGRMRLDGARFMLDCKTSEAADLQAQMADKEAGMSYLRRKNESLLLNLEKARRMIRGAGFGLQHIAAELPVGDETVGPGGTVNTCHFSQFLPADASGLWAVALYVMSADSETASPDGYLEVRVLRASDGKCLAQDAKPYVLSKGWLQFDLSGACSAVFGDAVLEVSWSSDADNAPLLALAGVDADRFGDDAGQTLALRLMKGLADPMGDVGTGDGYDLSPFRHCPVAPHVLRRRAAWAFGDLLTDIPYGESLVSTGADGDNWVQTHPHEKGPSGVKVRGALAAGVAEVSISVLTDHESGPNCLYSILAVEHLEGEDDAARSRKVLACLAGNTANQDNGIHAAQAMVAPKQTKTLTLNLEAPLENRADLYLVVEVPGGKATYGWCRWSGLEIGLEWGALEVREMPTPSNSAAALRMRSLKFPALAGRIEFVSGAKKLDELSKSLGFSPLLVSEETGSLQTHPLQDGLSAAIFEGGVPTTTLRVASEVETAHDAAPAFLYVLAVVSPSVTEKARAIRNVMSRIDPQNPATWQGINGRKTVQWQAKVLYARQAATIEIELALALDAPGDAVFAVKPAGQSVSYGWCRWYSLNITTAPETPLLAGPVDHG
ncbi:DUF6212 domain-containing protein [Kordiimonas lacus]|uniref:Uncharacterized protein n=1 Tax=Kordiimonas lacus TaxID=637679 RepID=A0A1G7F7P3_9PROT|nr:DUF6212 domain-containing protein [Kordiimonas lacus]SDE71927.1 hypothetical protein SAMN04488071_3656 [Kordiimonas lacus]